MKKRKINHEFVDCVPDALSEETLYVSINYATAVHLCLCGCGKEVVTPLSPTDWKLIFDGVSVSLDPSIGNWGFPCQSHYWIKNNEVIWAGKWSEDEVEAGREFDRIAKENYYADSKVPLSRKSRKSKSKKKDAPGLWETFSKRWR